MTVVHPTQTLLPSSSLHEQTYAWAGRLLVAYFWLTALYMYSPAGRTAPQGLGDLDTLAAVKVLIRGGSSLILGWILLRFHRMPQFRSMAKTLCPFIFLSALAVLSCVWSPFPEKTLGKAVAVVTGVCLALLIGVIAHDRRRVSWLAAHLSAICFCVTIGNLTAEILVHGGEFFQRYRIVSNVARDGVLMHITNSAQIAGLGLFLIVASRLLFRWRWAEKLTYAGIPLYVFFLFFANSRAISLTVALVLGLIILYRLPLRQLLAWTFVPVFALIVVLLLDPVLNSTEVVGDKLTEYLLRGQSTSEFAQLSGRDDKWEMALDGFWRTPFLGGGFDVVSGYTNVFVNGRWQPLPVHNLYLFVLTGLGLAGMTLFLWGLGRVYLPLFVRALLRRREATAATFAVAGLSIFLVVGAVENVFIDGRGVAGAVAYSLLGLAGAERLTRTWTSSESLGAYLR